MILCYFLFYEWTIGHSVQPLVSNDFFYRDNYFLYILMEKIPFLCKTLNIKHIFLKKRPRLATESNLVSVTFYNSSSS